MYHYKSLMLAIIVLVSITGAYEDFQFSGKVFDSDNTALQGAIVKLKGQNIADTTDASGAFLLEGSTTPIHPNTFHYASGGRIRIKNGCLMYVSDKPNEELHISIFNISGKLCETKKVACKHGRNTINLSIPELASQMFFIRVKSQSKTFLIKILKTGNTYSFSKQDVINHNTNSEQTTTGLKTRFNDTLTVYKTKFSRYKVNVTEPIIDNMNITLYAVTYSKPPKPDLGYRWVLLEDYSDEFLGSSLDTNKWVRLHNSGWQGRPPGKFVPEASSVGDGYLKIQNGVMNPPEGEWEYTCGSVNSKKMEAHYGFYEVRFKASLTRLSTTFWLACHKRPVPGGNGQYSLELDVQECIGNAGSSENAFRINARGNTHYRHVPPGATQEDFYTKEPHPTKLPTEVAESFHVYSVWWRDAKKCTYYANGNERETLSFRTDISSEPFDAPMWLNFVTEVYTWASPILTSDLDDNSRNKSLYDWVRSQKLVPVGEVVEDFEHQADIYEETLILSENPNTISSGSKLDFKYEFKTVENREINIQIEDNSQVEVFTAKIPALKGYGYAESDITIDFNPATGAKYTVNVDLRPQNASVDEAIQSDSFEVTGSR